MVQARKILTVSIISLCSSGCAYQANTDLAPARNVVTSYNKKIPGKWSLLVEADRLNTTVRSEDIKCSAHTFPVNFTTGFPASVRETLPNVVTQVEEVELGAEHSPASLKTRGLIQVRGDNLQARLKIVPGFWSANVVVDVDMTVAVTVDNGSGRVFGKDLRWPGACRSPERNVLLGWCGSREDRCRGSAARCPQAHCRRARQFGADALWQGRLKRSHPGVASDGAKLNAAQCLHLGRNTRLVEMVDHVSRTGIRDRRNGRAASSSLPGPHAKRC